MADRAYYVPMTNQPDLSGPDAYLDAVRSSAGDLRKRFVDDPIGLAEALGLLMPPKPVDVMKELGVYDPDKHGPVVPGLRELVEDVCTGAERSAAVVGPRGGGKSQGVSFIEFFLVFLKLYDALNLGGSELQADQVYQYLITYIDSDPFWREKVKGETLQSETKTVDNAWIRVLTASQKSVRSPHAGGRKKGGRMAGGILVIDEEAETDPEIVSAALPTINTARPSVNVRSSTFHNVTGSFADLIENHRSMGYKLYQWDIFDVCEGCDCVNECESTEKCFREDHYEDYIDPDTGLEHKKLIHRAYCGGRAMYAKGWIPMEEIITLWMRTKRNHATWEVEAMGRRPTTKGHVIRDHIAWDSNKTDEAGLDLYIPGYPVTICVDWGTAAAGVEAWQEQMGDRHALIYCEQVEDAGQAQIFAKILSVWYMFSQDAVEVAADIGGGGNYLNPKLRDEERLPVRDVNFGEEKEIAAAALNIYNESGLLDLPEEFDVFHKQAKLWKRKNGRIVKGNDHLMDTAVCYFAKFVDRLNIRKVRVAPRSASTAIQTQNNNGQRRPGESTHVPIRRPMMRTIGSRGRR